jgi:peptidyl-prolyl cis-trans isomerase A (cyclophilin A)
VREILALAMVAVAACAASSAEKPTAKKTGPVVLLETSMGNIRIELYPDKAPISVKNFLQYVEEGYYDGLVFHRVIKGFMIQGGGFTKDMKPRNPGHPPVRNEAGNGLVNDRGTVALARTNVVDSATSQFFINTVNNDFLNHVNDTPRGFGYAVFGRVIEGMDVVDRIQEVPTGNAGMFQDVPREPVVIKKAKAVK